jgi:hypothetical protein
MHDLMAPLATLRKSSTFLVLLGYRNKEGEVSDRTISFHVSYENALKRSIEKLEDMKGLVGVEVQARHELLASYRKSLSSPVEEADESSPYHVLLDADGESIKGLKVHKETQRLYVYGMQVPGQKRIIVPGTYKVVKSSEKTLAKKRLASELPVSRWRQFIISPENVREIKVEKMSFKPSWD